MPIDNNALFRSGSATITATETGATWDFGGPDLATRTYMQAFSGTCGSTSTILTDIEESDDNSTWRKFLSFSSAGSNLTRPNPMYVSGKSNARYRRYVSTVVGTPGIAITIALVPGGRDSNW